MGLFRRKESSPAAHPVSDFWTWWADSGRSISPHEVTPAHDVLTRRIQAIHPQLTWHFGPGESSEHRLTVSAGGVADVRPAAERWHRAAPAADSTWEYRPSQQADPDSMEHRLDIAGHQIDLSATTFDVDIDHDRRRVHVGVHHPAFAGMPVEASQQVTFLVLDWTLGEDEVERWVGGIDTLTDAPETTSSAEDLIGAVAELQAARDPESWAVAEWTADGGERGLAMFRTGIRWIDQPTLDLHHEIVAPYAAQDDGLPEPQALDRLRSLEDELVDAVGNRGILVAHQTATGRRIFHFYTDGEDQNAADSLRAALPPDGVTMTSTPDPAWHAVRAFTG
jgi:hypothetical protein